MKKPTDSRVGMMSNKMSSKIETCGTKNRSIVFELDEKKRIAFFHEEVLDILDEIEILPVNIAKFSTLHYFQAANLLDRMDANVSPKLLKEIMSKIDGGARIYTICYHREAIRLVVKSMQCRMMNYCQIL